MNSFSGKTLQDLKPKRRVEVELRGRSSVVLVVEAKVDQFVRRGSSLKTRRSVPEAALPVLVNAIIQNASTKPQDAPVMVYMIWNRPPGEPSVY